MSTNSSIMIDIAQEIFTINLLHVIGLSILYYDHLITFGNEVESIWRRSKRKSGYLFFLNRYFALFSNIAESVFFFKQVESERCKVFTLLREVIIACNQGIVAVLLSLRVYALYERSSRVAWFIVGSAVVLISIAGWGLSGGDNFVTLKASGCSNPLSRSSAIRKQSFVQVPLVEYFFQYMDTDQATPWEALLAYDLILFSLTMFKSWRGRNDYVVGQSSVSLRYIVVRDGAIYFIIIGAANLANIFTFYFCAPILRGGLSTFASNMSSTIMSHLMLNLHENANSGIYYTSRETQSRFQAASHPVL